MSVTIGRYADTLSDALNADLPDGEPAWAVGRHPTARGVLVVSRATSPPLRMLVWWRSGAIGAEPATGWTERGWARPEYTGIAGARKLAADLLDPANWRPVR